MTKWCNTCKATTKQTFIKGNHGNNTYKCTVCGCLNHEIQGFNANLM